MTAPLTDRERVMLAVLNNIAIRGAGSEGLRIFIKMPGLGFWSVVVPTEMREMAETWEASREAAIAAAQPAEGEAVNG